MRPLIRYYDLCHTHASLLIADGMQPMLVAERLGHASIKLTMDTYGHLSRAVTARPLQRWIASSEAGGKRIVWPARKFEGFAV
jgi:integrase